MNGLTRFLVSVGTVIVVLKIITVKPVKKYLLGALVDGAYYMIKRRLKD